MDCLIHADADIVANIMIFLPLNTAFKLREVSKTWKRAVRYLKTRATNFIIIIIIINTSCFPCSLPNENKS